MKKVKLMLLSLALVSVVGGALAFKAKTGQRFCTTLASTFGIAGATTCVDPVSPFAILKCPNDLQGSTTDTNEGLFYCTTPTNGFACDANTICETGTKQIKVE